MQHSDIQPLVTAYHRMLGSVTFPNKRFLYSRIDWRERMIGIKGPRGAGKTTLLLQRIREAYKDTDKAIWVSLDNLWFQTHNVDELVDWLYSYGVTDIFFDEVHKCPQWTLRLKNYYDNYPDLRIVYTGSSMLEIDNSNVDLSRRQSLYSLPVMSFREYLSMEGLVGLDALTLDNLLADHVEIATELCSKHKILKHFEAYLDHGQYPFYKTDGAAFHRHLAATANLCVESDLPAVADVTYPTVEKTKRLLMIVAESVPFVPNISKLAAALNTTRDMCLKLLYLLDRAGVLCLLTRQRKSYKQLAAPEKIYLANTNLIAALSANGDTGNRRETFFLSQLRNVAEIAMPSAGDFTIDGRTFEVGGPSKDFTQIKDMDGSYLIIDGIETGHGARIPLWMFGLLY